jgi:NADPH-dependent curcumin reductase CurA
MFANKKNKMKKEINFKVGDVVLLISAEDVDLEDKLPTLVRIDKIEEISSLKRYLVTILNTNMTAYCSDSNIKPI